MSWTSPSYVIGYTAAYSSALHGITASYTNAIHGISQPWVAYVNGQPVINSPVNTSLPVITGTVQVGFELSCSTGDWTSPTAIVYTYLWLRDGSPIGGATANTYTLVAADYNTMISCQVTATNSDASTPATTAESGPVIEAAPVNTVAPVASGYVYAGKTLSTTNGTWTSVATPTYTYQWKRNGTNVANGTNSTYAVVTADEGQSMTCTVTATNAGGGTSAGSNTLTNWTPGSLTLTNWYDYADVPTMTYDGGTGAISQINDKSGNGRNATQSTSNRQPILSVSAVNSLYAALYDGSNDRMDFNTSGDLTTFTVIVIAKPARLRQYDAFLDSATGSTNQLTCEQSDLSRIDFYDYNVGRKAISSGTISTSAPFVLKWSYDGTTLRTSVNNAGAGSDTQASAVLKQACSMGGDHGSGGFYYFSGYLCEVLVAASVLTSQNYTDLQTYAQNKWGTS